VVLDIRDAESLTERVRLRGHSGPVRSLQFSPDGTLLASGAEDRTAIVWDLADSSPRDVLRGHAGGVNRVAFSPDGATLYTVGEPGLLVWDLEGDRRFARLATPFAPGTLTTAALPSPDGEAIVHLTNARASNDGGTTMSFYDVADQHVGEPIDLGYGAWSPARRAGRRRQPRRRRQRVGLAARRDGRRAAGDRR
jgi:WD40 repeat protein